MCTQSRPRAAACVERKYLTLFLFNCVVIELRVRGIYYLFYTVWIYDWALDIPVMCV